MAQNVYQFIDVKRVDPPKKSLDARTIEFVEDLGRNTMGKINKRKLRAPYWEK